jgi:hypothetical protein
LNRKCIMQEMHNNFQEGEDWDVPPVSWFFSFGVGFDLIWFDLKQFLLRIKILGSAYSSNLSSNNNNKQEQQRQTITISNTNLKNVLKK